MTAAAYTDAQLRQMLARHEKASLGLIEVSRVEGKPSQDEPSYAQLIGAVGVQTPQEYGVICDTLNADYRRHAEGDKDVMYLLAVAHNALPALIEELLALRGAQGGERMLVACSNGHRSTVPADAYSDGVAATHSCPVCGLGVPKDRTDTPPAGGHDGLRREVR